MVDFHPSGFFKNAETAQPHYFMNYAQLLLNKTCLRWYVVYSALSIGGTMMSKQKSESHILRCCLDSWQRYVTINGMQGRIHFLLSLFPIIWWQDTQNSPLYYLFMFFCTVCCLSCNELFVLNILMSNHTCVSFLT